MAEPVHVGRPPVRLAGRAGNCGGDKSVAADTLHAAEEAVVGVDMGAAKHTELPGTNFV
jgi:hypothetical protein